MTLPVADRASVTGDVPTAAASTGVHGGDAVAERPGWYCYAARPALAAWDGVAWTGDRHATCAAPLLAGPPGALAFLRSRWFTFLLLGQALVVLPALLSGTTGNARWAWISVVGYLSFLTGGVLVVTRFLGIDGLPGHRTLTWIGIGSGVVASGVGIGLEVLVDHTAGWAATLWMTGPIEESAKLAVPVGLLVFGARRFALPTVGLYLVLVSGATVGVLEGVEYEARPEFAWAHLQMALVRPTAELFHVFVTGFAAGVIWLAAWRRGRTVTGAGVVAFLVAVSIHSVNDGIVTLFRRRPPTFGSALGQTLHEALVRGLGGLAFSLVLTLLYFLLVRHSARELTGPGRIAACPPPWRPQIKRWGCDPGTAPVAAAVPWVGAVPVRPPGPVVSLIPTVAPPAWYPVAGQPGTCGWWNGTSWTDRHRWTGSAWVPW